jgi:hypothetical protein
MVEVSGLSLVTMPKFITDQFGEQKFHQWIDQLPREIQHIYNSRIMVNQWFDLQTTLVEPMKILFTLFCGGRDDLAWEFGRYSADYALKGILKVFVRIGSINYFVRRAAIVIPNYYRPVIMRAVKNEARSALLEIIEFNNIHSVMEKRIGGWMERALEISGAENPKIELIRSMAGGDQTTLYDISW